MALKIKLVGFYKHTNDKEEIKPNSEQAKEILLQEGSFRKMHSFNSTFGGPLYGGSKELIEYCKAEDLGGSYIMNANRAQIYEVIMKNTSGFAQYLSVILKGPYRQEVVNKLSQAFEDADFAPKHSYLGKNDDVMTPNYGIKPLWLDDLVEFKSII